MFNISDWPHKDKNGSLVVYKEESKSYCGIKPVARDNYF